MSLIRSTYNNQVIALHIDEKLSEETFAELNPLAESILEDNAKLRFLIILNDFKGWNAAGFWQDIAFDLKFYDDIERIAVVGNSVFKRLLTTFVKPFTEAKVQYFTSDKHYDARQWITENLDSSDRVHFELDEDTNILSIKLNHPILESDLSALKALISSHVAAGNGLLRGILIDAEFFSGWENFHTLVEQLKFIKDHHKDVERVALVCPTHLATESIPQLLNHFINAEVQHFNLDSIGMNWLKRDDELR